MWVTLICQTLIGGRSLILGQKKKMGFTLNGTIIPLFLKHTSIPKFYNNVRDIK